MGINSRIIWAMILALGISLLTSVSTVFAYENPGNSSNPFTMIYGFFQKIQNSIISIQTPSIGPSEINSAALIVQLKNEVEELKSRINSLEDPTKIYSTELHPVTEIDCSSRNMVEAFLSGWCPHQTRNIYFIEDARITKESVIAITLEQKYDAHTDKNAICGIINQDVFNFSFYDEKTGKAKHLEGLHGFIMKCDQSPIDSQSVLKYTVINT